jgi:hypothetical protein
MIDLPDNLFGFAIIPKTALRPNQSTYFATLSFQLPPLSYYIFYIEQGFSVSEEWIPAGKRFSIWYANFSISQNSLIESRIGVESQSNQGNITWLARKWGYGDTDYLAGVFFDFEALTRPIYYIANYSNDTVYVDFTVFGVVEVII